MNIPRTAAGLRLAALIAALICIACPTSATESPISDAERMLFVTDHLKSVPVPATLDYKVHHDGTLDKAFEDEAHLYLAPGPQGQGRTTTARYLSGDRQMQLPALDFAQGNPVLLHFLERDIREMERLTGGKANYFRKRIRLALAEGAQVRPTRVSYANREVAAVEIVVKPYLNDPNRTRFEKYIGKTYVFVLADEVPGQLVSAEAVIPNPDGTSNAPPLLIERLSFVGLKRGSSE